MDDNKNGRGTGYSLVVPRGQSHLRTRNRTMGNLAKLQDGVPPMKVIGLMPAGKPVGDGRILLMFQTASHFQPGTLELCQAGLQK